MNSIQQKESTQQDLIKEKNDITQEGVLFLRFNRIIKKVFLSDIDYFEAKSNSTRCFVKGEALLLRVQMNDIEKMLPKGEFARIHKSYIIPIRKIDKIVKHVVYINETALRIGANYREMFYLMLPSYLY
jgi:Response regulator of the LytR/AlgR family